VHRLLLIFTFLATSQTVLAQGNTYVQNYGVICDGNSHENNDTDFGLALAAATGSGNNYGTLALPAGGTCILSGPVSLPSNIVVDLNGGTLGFTGSGGGTCSAGTNGLIRYTNTSGAALFGAVKNGTLVDAYSNGPSCLINVSASEGSFAQRFILENVKVQGPSVAGSVAFWTTFSGLIFIRNNNFTGWDNHIVTSNQFNASAIENNQFNQSVAGNYMFYLDSSQAVKIKSNTFDGGPLGIHVSGATEALEIDSNWFGDTLTTSNYQWIDVANSVDTTSVVSIHGNWIQGGTTGNSIAIESANQGFNGATISVENNFFYICGTCVNVQARAVKVSNNSMQGTKTGILVLGDYAFGDMIENNSIYASATAIELHGSGHIISNNQIINGSIDCANMTNSLLIRQGNPGTACSANGNTILSPGIAYDLILSN
jgi:hypothetical protein